MTARQTLIAHTVLKNVKENKQVLHAAGQTTPEFQSDLVYCVVSERLQRAPVSERVVKRGLTNIPADIRRLLSLRPFERLFS